MKKIFLIVALILILLGSINCKDKNTGISSGNSVNNESYFTYPNEGTLVSGNFYLKVSGNNIDKVVFRWPTIFVDELETISKIYCFI